MRTRTGCWFTRGHPTSSDSALVVIVALAMTWQCRLWNMEPPHFHGQGAERRQNISVPAPTWSPLGATIIYLHTSHSGETVHSHPHTHRAHTPWGPQLCPCGHDGQCGGAGEERERRKEKVLEGVQRQLGASHFSWDLSFLLGRVTSLYPKPLQTDAGIGVGKDSEENDALDKKQRAR